MNVGKEIAVLKHMPATELRAKYAEVFGEDTRSRHKDYLVKHITWRLQSLAEDDLSERARARRLTSTRSLSTPSRRCRIRITSSSRRRRRRGAGNEEFGAGQALVAREEGSLGGKRLPEAE